MTKRNEGNISLVVIPDADCGVVVFQACEQKNRSGQYIHKLKILK